MKIFCRPEQQWAAVVTAMPNAVLLATLETQPAHGSLKPRNVQFQSRKTGTLATMMLKLYFLGFLIRSFLTIGIETQPAHGSLKPRNVQFQSRNFHNILRWQPGSFLTRNGSIYFVQYKMYGERQWKNKTDCWGTPALFCDLTNETLNLYEPYYGRVKTARAGSYSAWSRTPRFTPWWETKLDPPAVTMVQVNGSLLVLLRAPELPYRAQNGNNTSMENYYDLVYRVFIIDNLLEKEQKAYEGTQRIVQIEGLTPRSGYCVMAEIYQPVLGRKSPRSERRCV